MSAPRRYELAVSYWADRDDVFLRQIRRCAADCNVNLLVIEPLWVDEVLAKHTNQRLTLGVLLDLAADFTDPSSPYTRLALQARERGVRVINDPVRAACYSHKGEAHTALHRAGMPLPFGLVVTPDEAQQRCLTDGERAGLGNPFFVKPCHGFAGKGVIADAHSLGDVSRAHALVPDSHYLLQRRVEFAEVGGQPAYWRVIHTLGDVSVCWWHPATGVYSLTLQWQIEDFALWPLFDLGHRLAEETRLDFFSVEAARTPAGEYLLIDYVNEQIDLRAKSFCHDGVPDELVRQIARRIVAVADGERRRHPAGRDADLHDEWPLRAQARYRAARRPWPGETVEPDGRNAEVD